MPTFSFVAVPQGLTAQLLHNYNAPLPLALNQVQGTIHSFGSMFMPDYYPCRTARLVSCYALFK